MFKKMLPVLAIMLICTATISAQDYKTAIGLRLGLPYGISAKHFINPDNALDIIIARSSRKASQKWDWSYNATVLYTIHTDPLPLDKLRFFYGGGGHIGIYYTPFFKPEPRANFGLDAVGGWEYTVDNIPLNISMDIKPAMNFFDPFSFYVSGAVTVRYILTY